MKFLVKCSNCFHGSHGHWSYQQKDFVSFFLAFFCLSLGSECSITLSDAFSSILPSQLIEFNLNQNTRWIDIVETLHTNRLRATRELKFSFQTLSCLLLSSSPSAGPSRHISSETFVNFHSGTFRGDLSITACQYFTFQMTLPFYEVISSHLSNFHLLPE